MWPFSKKKKSDTPVAQPVSSRPNKTDQEISEMYVEAKNAVG